MMNGSGDAGHDEEGGEEHGGFMRLHRLSELSPEVRKRVAALRKLQLDSLNVEVDFYKVAFKLYLKFDLTMNVKYLRHCTPSRWISRRDSPAFTAAGVRSSPARASRRTRRPSSRFSILARMSLWFVLSFYYLFF